MRQTVFLKHVLAVTALLVISLPSWAFIAQTREGVNMTFNVISEDDKTCEVGDGLNTSNAIDVSYSGSLTIPETANGYTVISIDGHAFTGCSGLTSITIPETVTNICDYAFWGCAFTEPIYNSRFFVFLPRSYVGEYVLPQTIKTICSYAFCDCYDLTSVIIPEGVIDIRGEAFYECRSLTSLTLPESLTSIGDMCIGCPVTSINIPESLTSVGYGAFYGCSELKDPTYNSRFFVRLPKSYEGGYVIPQTIETICDGAFNGCSGLTSVTISKNVSSIGEMGLFGSATNLNTIIVSAENSNYDSRNSCNAIIEKATNTLVAGCKTTVIPNTVTKIATSAFGDCIGLTSIIIPSSVTSTGDYVFQGCTGLTTVEMSSNQATIEIGTFNGCTSLTSINIPDGVTCIREVAFSNCGLTSVTIPQSVTTIEGEAFRNCSSLTSITVESGNSYYDSRDNCNAIIETSTNKLIQGCANTIIPNFVTSIGDDAFAGSGLTSITIPSSVTSIGDDAFANSGLTSITIPSSVTSIGFNTFGDCSGLTSITIPSSVTSIGDVAFYGCSGLTSITIPSSVTSIGGRMFDNCSCLASVVVKNSTPVTIDENTFSNRSNATLYVPAGSIDSYANAEYWKEFKEIKEIEADVIFTAQTDEGVTMTFKVISESEKTCMVGTEEGEGSVHAAIAGDYSGGITIPSEVSGYTVTRVGKWAFSWIGGLTSVSIPETVTSIGTQAFNFTGLTAITLPRNLKTIEDGVFQGCTGITSVTIPASVTSIADGTTFDAATNLASIEVESGNQVYDSWYDCNAIIETATNSLIQGCKNSVIPNSVTNIADGAFLHCTTLTSIDIPSSVTSIGNRAFFGCSGLSSLSLPENLEFIDIEAFNGCDGLTSIVIPASVTSIGYGAFFDCKNLTSIIVDSGNTIYDSRDNCNAIIETSSNTLISGCQNTTIPSSVTSIGEWAFAGCSGLTAIFLPSNLKTIESLAFNCCSSLTSITIPEGVTSIGNGAFDGCSNLTSVTVCNGTPVSISENPFSDRANATLYVPAGSKSAYQAADYWKDFGRIVEGIPLVDGETYSNNTDMALEEISYTRTYKKSAWLSWYVPFDLTLTSDVLNNFSFAKFCGSYTEEDGNGDDVFCITVSRLKAGDVVKANTPYVVKAKTASNDPQVITVTNATLKAAEERVLNMYSAEKKISIKGIYSPKNATEQDCDWYFINSTGYVHAQAGQTLGANRIFLTITDREDNLYASTPNPNNVKLKVLDDDEETSLEELATDDGLQTTEHAVYDLSGRRILNDKLESGIYIINGKKVFVK